MKLLLVAILVLSAFLVAACTDYDVETADTRANKRGFAKHLGFEPSDEVSGIYYYADEVGGDVRYQITFECSKELAEKIIRFQTLQPKPDNYSGLSPRDDLKWWKPDSIEGRPMWIKKDETGRYYREFWYSKEDGRAYYHEYSI